MAGRGLMRHSGLFASLRAARFHSVPSDTSRPPLESAACHIPWSLIA